MFDVLKEAYTIAKRKRKERALATAKARVAKAFNDIYTYTHEYKTDTPRLTEGSAMYGMMPRGGYAWMCPTCNEIHHPTSCSAMSGLQYPACCGFGEGNRLSHGIKTS
jgi:hypothetical protein